MPTSCPCRLIRAALDQGRTAELGMGRCGKHRIFQEILPITCEWTPIHQIDTLGFQLVDLARHQHRLHQIGVAGAAERKRLHVER